MKKILVYLDSSQGEAVVCEANDECRQDEYTSFGHNWEDWPSDLGLYDKGAGLYIIESEDDFESGKIRTLTREEGYKVMKNEQVFE